MEKTPVELFTDKTPEKLGLTRIDRFEILEQIGIGAMGIVYRVHDPVFSCDRALKILRPELIHEADTVQRFREEGRAAVRAAGEISHPNIVTVYDAGVFDNRPYIVMELFRGVPLDSLLEKERNFPILRILSIGEQLAGALASAHTHGVVHRDIKPGNVLISEDKSLAKLTDFSVAQLRAGMNSSLTRTGVVIGAPRYMPPEQALGKEVDGRSDLYGLGVMLYEMLTGEKAYKSETFTALLIEISQSQLPSVRSINKSVTPGVERIISKLVEKDPARRFQTGSELQEALRREIRNMNAKDSSTKRGLAPEILAAAILSIMVAGLLGLTSYLLKNQHIEALEKQTAAIGLEYAGALANQFSLDYARTGDDAGLLYQLQFDENGRNDNIDYQKIVLENGRILASSDIENTSSTYENPEIIRPIGIGGDSSQVDLIRTPSGRELLQVAQKIEIGPARNRRTIGSLYVGLPTDRIQDIGKLTTSLMLAMTFFVTFLIGIVSYYLVRRFAKPMEKLRDMLTLISTGDYDVRMPGDQKGLIGETYEAFNKAAETITSIPEPISLTPTEQWQSAEDGGINDIDEQTSEINVDISKALGGIAVSDKTVVVPMREEVGALPSVDQAQVSRSTKTLKAKTPKTASAAKKVIASPKVKSKATSRKKAPPQKPKTPRKTKAAPKTSTKAAAKKPSPKTSRTNKTIEKKSAPTKLTAKKAQVGDQAKTVNPTDIPVDDKTRVFRIEDIT